MRTARSKTDRELRVELERVHARLNELEATQNAIRNGDVDAIVVEGPNGSKVFTLQSPDDPYRILAERMSEGAATMSADGTILFCNRRLAEMVEIPPERLLGASISLMLSEEQRNGIEELLQSAVDEDVRTEGELLRKDGSALPVLLSFSLVTLGEAEKVFCLVATDLSELKQAKRSFREQSEIFELAQDAIMIQDLQKRIQSWNRGARDLYGWPAEEVIGKVTFELLHTVFPEPFEAIMASLASEKEWEGELMQIRRDGGTVVVWSRWSLLRDESDIPTAILEINRDITASKEASTALHKSQALLEQTGKAAGVGGWGFDFETKELTWAAETYHILGADPSLRPTLEEAFDLCTPESRSVIAAAFQKAAADGQGFDLELALVRFDGRLINARAVASAIFDGGKPVRLVGAFQDITERKNAEIALRKSEDAYRRLAELVPQLVWKCTPDGLNVYFNRQWVDYTGLTLEQSYGRGWNTPFHPDDKAAAWAVWNHAVETGDDYRVDCRLRAADGTYRWFLVKGIPVRDDKGAIVEWFGTCTDIDDLIKAETARAEAMQELRELNEELESRVALRTRELAESMKDLESFAYSVSHDLRAPLRHLDGYLSLLFKRSYSALDEQAKHYIDSTLDASRRMGRLIDELLQFSRLGRSDLRKAHVDLNRLVEEMRAELEPETRDRVVHWSVESLPMVEADQGMLRQVIANLLGNALKFTRNVAEARISIGCKSDASGELVLSIEDNGAGFDMRYYNKLFQVFQRLHGEDEFEGTGIGLATVRRIVERHGGRIWAEGAVGVGATFHFSLPRDCDKNGEYVGLVKSNFAGGR